MAAYSSELIDIKATSYDHFLILSFFILGKLTYNLSQTVFFNIENPTFCKS